jgi:serine/threonine-protein kinase HipA
MAQRDHVAVVWTRLGGQPQKMGSLVVTGSEARFTYTPEYRATGQRGLGLAYPPAAFSGTIVRPRNEFFDLHPPLQALVPQRSEANFQRQLILRYLARLDIHPDSGFDTDWQILMHAGHGGIGHLDVFPDDEAAQRWYSTPSKKGLVNAGDAFGFSLREFMTWYDAEAAAIIDAIGPTPTVGGAIPKIPLSISRHGWDGQIGMPTRFGDTDRTDVILKLEKTTAYPGIVELEELGLEMHRIAGFDVPRSWPIKVGDINALAIERFDRTPQGQVVYMESVYSVLASGARDITSHYSTSYDRIGAMLDTTKVEVIADRKKAKQHLLERLLMAMLTGNGDLHLENLAIIDGDNGLSFSPVYDPTPMRAYSIHDALVPQGMSFGNYGDINHRTGEVIGFAEGMKTLAKNLGMHAQLGPTVSRLLQVMEDYPDRIQQLSTVPAHNRENLIKRHKEVRQKLNKL